MIAIKQPLLESIKRRVIKRIIQSFFKINVTWFVSFPYDFSGNPPFWVMDSCLRRNDKPHCQRHFLKISFLESPQWNINILLSPRSGDPYHDENRDQVESLSHSDMRDFLILVVIRRRLAFWRPELIMVSPGYPVAAQIRSQCEQNHWDSERRAARQGSRNTKG